MAAKDVLMRGRKHVSTLRPWAAGVMVTLLLSLFSGAAFAGGPWKGRIVDVETKEPLEGTVVLAVWYRVYRTPYGDNAYFYEAKETLTDKDGKFDIRSYTPFNLLPIISYMQGPLFTVFKPGYGCLEDLDLGGYFTGQASEIQEMTLKARRYRLAAEAIELPRLRTKEERRFASPSPLGHEKDWKKQRLLIQALRDEWEYLTGEEAGDLYQIKGD